MNTHAETQTIVSSARARRFAFASMLALALAPRVAAAEELALHTAAAVEPPQDHSGWSLNATPVLILPEDNYGWGGGGDPELKYTHDLGPARVSVGGRVGIYYAKDQFGLSAMPTLRLMVPLGGFEPYVAGGLGYGWLTKSGHKDFVSMTRAGFLYRFTPSFAIGLEGTAQQLDNSDYRFFSVGSMMAFDL
jgi:hypothetical protein